MLVKSKLLPSETGSYFSVAIRRHAEDLIKEYGIKVENSTSPVKALSGGNIQKVILARELCEHPKFLICVQPTRGLDIGAVEYVQNLLINARNQGISILLISTELDEILALSDRIAIAATLFGGLLVAVILLFLLRYVLKHTTFGYQVSVVGNSERSAKYAGISAKKTVFM